MFLFYTNSPIQRGRYLEINCTTSLQINLMVISDYGVSDTAALTDVNLEEHIDEDDYQYIIYTGGYAKITPYALKHEEILMECMEMEGVDCYITRQVQDPPLWNGVQVPEDLKFAEGSHVQDILFVAKPAFQLTTNQSNEKIMNVNGFPNDFLAKGVAGRNPYLKEVKWPKILKGEHPTPEQLQQRVDHKHYHQFKYDMQTRAYLMGPGKN